MSNGTKVRISVDTDGGLIHFSAANDELLINWEDIDEDKAAVTIDEADLAEVLNLLRLHEPS